ncbi:scabin-related ADP-ribosyltransferase [Kitasatospora purpeofusca]|uniref:scabin-related ADP-ribosyltransferase n=1 Tax=Kitasatospora purpeofusca TaxID=67352 RepID=UPI00224ED59B|nr:enterotoxin A family protein [Kitasatospora purpeofusca]MCX4756203.1 enterotoxin A family protein [Kitasatospora purpeofusca]WSR35965.1 enterotoxin A family protein [Kitasatospora purpeofusca]
MYRADTRGHDEIFANGFEPKGDNLDINQHVHENRTDSGFVSTSRTRGAAEGVANDFYMDDDTHIYKIRGSGIDVNAHFGKNSPYPWEEEIALAGKVHPHDIEGVWNHLGEWTPNPRFRR